MAILTVDRTLSQCEKVTVSAFCRRRVPVVMVRLKMAETLKEAVTFVEQGRGLKKERRGRSNWDCELIFRLHCHAIHSSGAPNSNRPRLFGLPVCAPSFLASLPTQL